MPQLRLALNQMDSTVGDLAGNSEAVVRWTRHAVDGGAHLVAFPELQLSGYPLDGLALRPSFARASRAAVDALAGRLAAEGLGEVPVVVGYLDRVEEDEPERGRPAGAPLDAAAVLYGGAVRLRFAGRHVSGGAPGEDGRFAPGTTLPVVRVRGVDVALAVRGDLVRDGGRAAAVRAAGAGLLLAVGAAPWEPGGGADRLALVRGRAREAGCALACVCMIGGQDELVFDGDSVVVDAAGGVLARAPQFEEGCVLVDLDLPAAGPAPRGTADGGLEVEHAILSAEPLPPYQAEVPGGEAPRLGDDEEVYTALVIGLRAYTAKNGFPSVLLPLTGRIGSALVAALACDALGAERVYGVAMPSGYARDGSAELARRTGLNVRTVPIAPLVDAYRGVLGPAGPAGEALRARVRGTVLAGLADREGHLVLATGDRSEFICGWAAPRGAGAGGFAPLKDVPATAVVRLARWRNDAAVRRGEAPPVPEAFLGAGPDALPGGGALPYAVLDGILQLYVEQGRGRDEVVAAGFEAEAVDRVVRAVDGAEDEWRRCPPGTRVWGVVGAGRMPVTSRWWEGDGGRV